MCFIRNKKKRYRCTTQEKKINLTDYSLSYHRKVSVDSFMPLRSNILMSNLEKKKNKSITQVCRRFASLNDLSHRKYIHCTTKKRKLKVKNLSIVSKVADSNKLLPRLSYIYLSIQYRFFLFKSIQ
jgi:hypothetical protein